MAKLGMTGPVLTNRSASFSVDFYGAALNWLTDPTEIVVNGLPSTHGENNRRWLHKKFDEFLDTQMEKEIDHG